ncbi:hypothetical protein [Nocardioides sp.]
MTGRQGFALGFAAGAGLAAWVFPLAHYLTNAADGRGLLYPKDDR